ncbi:MAG TPA: TIGR01212 family radical SAM protein [Lachnospiraceae bacterium]|nr:TIGR01212 family radical SAM protein [Lachnospiraceae bacterium]
MQKQWGQKSYYSFDYYVKSHFGQKLYKLSLNGHMTCPNRDGTLDTRGCIFCSEGGSGEFTPSYLTSVTAQIEEAKKLISGKYHSDRYIAYFQAYTNTYAPVPRLRKLYMEAVLHPDIAALSIATRPDCLGGDVLALLAEINRIKPVFVELGLQTIHEDTAVFIRRGYPLARFTDAVTKLHALAIPVVVHLILGLPGETPAQMLSTVQYMNMLPISGVKLQLLHVLKHTTLASLYEAGLYTPLTQEAYTSILIDCIGHLCESIAIHRITGDAPKQLLIAPLWSADKKKVLNNIHKELKKQQIWQGKYLTQN